jgi:hypothetical protein
MNDAQAERTRRISRKLPRPDKCEKCLKVGRVQAHHFDYNDPKAISFLCARCHRIWHAENGSLIDDKGFVLIRIKESTHELLKVKAAKERKFIYQIVDTIR